MEFLTGATAAVGAGFFTNPLEVVKTRFQLQGELQKRGKYVKHYKNFFHAFYVIGKTEGVFALQKGLSPALMHQVLLNGVRLGGYQVAEKHKWNLKENGEISMSKTAFIGSIVGIISGYASSPLFLAKTRLQSQAAESIAVGHQHKVNGTFDTLKAAYNEGRGIKGLWRGVVGSLPRQIIGSASQLTTFALAKEYLETNKYFRIEPGLLNTFLASMIGGVAVAIAMGPPDVVCTRLYNQGVDKQGKGLLYDGFFDCAKKIFRTEGFPGFYKGIVPCYMRIGPHTMLCLTFWDQLKGLQNYYKNKTQSS